VSAIQELLQDFAVHTDDVVRAAIIAVILEHATMLHVLLPRVTDIAPRTRQLLRANDAVALIQDVHATATLFEREDLHGLLLLAAVQYASVAVVQSLAVRLSCKHTALEHKALLAAIKRQDVSIVECILRRFRASKMSLHPRVFLVASSLGYVNILRMLAEELIEREGTIQASGSTTDPAGPDQDSLLTACQSAVMAAVMLGLTEVCAAVLRLMFRRRLLSQSVYESLIEALAASCKDAFTWFATLWVEYLLCNHAPLLGAYELVDTFVTTAVDSGKLEMMQLILHAGATSEDAIPSPLAK